MIRRPKRLIKKHKSLFDRIEERKKRNKKYFTSFDLVAVDDNDDNVKTYVDEAPKFPASSYKSFRKRTGSMLRGAAVHKGYKPIHLRKRAKAASERAVSSKGHNKMEPSD